MLSPSILATAIAMFSVEAFGQSSKNPIRTLKLDDTVNPQAGGKLGSDTEKCRIGAGKAEERSQWSRGRQIEFLSSRQGRAGEGFGRIGPHSTGGRPIV